MSKPGESRTVVAALVLDAMVSYAPDTRVVGSITAADLVELAGPVVADAGAMCPRCAAAKLGEGADRDCPVCQWWARYVPDGEPQATTQHADALEQRAVAQKDTGASMVAGHGVWDKF